MSYNSCGCNSAHTTYSRPLEMHHSECLVKDNYLSEFLTEVEKARVRENLGIADEFSMTWENIQGLIENNPQIIELFNNISKEISELKNKINTLSVDNPTLDLSDINNKINGIESTLDEQNSTIQGIQRRLDNLSTQGYDDSSVLRRLNALEELTHNLELSFYEKLNKN